MGPLAQEADKFFACQALLCKVWPYHAPLKEVSPFIFTPHVPLFVKKLRKFLNFTGPEHVLNVDGSERCKKRNI